MCLFLILLLSLAIKAQTSTEECDNWSKTYMTLMDDHSYFNNSKIIIKLNSFEELNVNCSDIFFLQVYTIKLFAQKKLFLESNFTLQALNSLFNISGDKLRPVEIFNIKGFNFNRNSTKSQLTSAYTKFVNFNFDFYLDKIKIADKETCLSLKTVLSEHKEKSFMPLIRNMDFRRKIFYSKTVCPYVFIKSPLRSISFFEITNSLIYKNTLEFIDVNETDEFDMHLNKFENLALDIAYERITHKLVEKNVFKHIKFLSLNGIIYNIQTDLFASFREIRLIYISVDNFGIFFHKGLNWLKHLNLGINVSLNETELNIRHAKYDLKYAMHVIFHEEYSIFRDIYEYPNEDLCLFKDFPHHRLVLPTILTAKIIPCSCTLIWMIQYSNFYLYKNFTYYRKGLWTLIINVSKSEKVIHCLLDTSNFTLEIEGCNFEINFKNCENSKLITSGGREVGFFDEKNIVFEFKWLKYLVEVFIQPILCLLGIITNLLTIKVIRNRSTPFLKKNLHNVMYEHQLASSIFNVILCSIKILSLMNICIFPRTSFCSSINEDTATQYFKIYIVNFLGNAVRLGSNFSYMLFSISRFYLIDTAPSKFFKKLQKINTKIFYSILTLFCLSFSSFRIFQFKINDFFDVYEQNFPFDAYAVNWCEDELILKTSNFLSLCQFFTVINLVNNIFNNIIFFFVSFVIDLNLIRLSNENLKNKKKLFPHNKVHIDEAIRFKEKINKMIFVNGLFYFTSHFPEFIVTLLLIIFRKALEHHCFTLFSCVDLIEVSQSLNFAIIFSQFFLFKKFDKNFNDSFQNLRKRAFAGVWKSI
jgi:hypothetical protein